MVYKITFEADVQGLASVTRINDSINVYAKDVSTARHFAEGYISGSYSDSYAIMSCVPLLVFNLGGD